MRLIDANVNRCREGLRVIEDTARFVLGNGTLYRRLRALRHSVDKATRRIYPQMIAHRNSVSDTGRALKECKRDNIRAVASANFRRVEESLRVLEEYGRLLIPGSRAVFKEIRYKVYNYEKQLIDMF
ncbi:MAG: hypothetical protein A2219_06085 [Elusimicrobia bacterium RIFOXYA2_FULL_50_26]|nr:MAG: hypothetical protein A2219_06085 [Elusimicrobia bacterium RIFOXYA2_FULL_50_26]OGS25169.1 MAG: hypothetical protein A2314_02830 [Elusimicrobia bacterium RIFOXYB2_FULL_50_12]